MRKVKSFEYNDYEKINSKTICGGGIPSCETAKTLDSIVQKFKEFDKDEITNRLKRFSNAR